MHEDSIQSFHIEIQVDQMQLRRLFLEHLCFFLFCFLKVVQIFPAVLEDSRWAQLWTYV